MYKHSVVRFRSTGMRPRRRVDCLKIAWGLLALVLSSCSTKIPPGKNAAPSGTRLTLPSYYEPYYSSPKARALGEIHSRDLERLTDRLVQGPIGQLQFANAVVSLSMGFFTHAHSQPPDQRYLEVILGMPDILDDASDFNTNISQLFAQYGRDLLTVLASDRAVANDEKIAGYGLNFSWRSVTVTPSGPRMTLNEVVIYIGKDRAEQFLHRQVDQEMLLGNSTLFFHKGEQPAKQVAYVSPTPQPQMQVFTGQAMPIRLQQQPDLVGTPPLNAPPGKAVSQSESSAPLKESHKEVPPLPEPQSVVSPRKTLATEEPLFTTPQEQAPENASSPLMATPDSVRPQPEYLVQLWYGQEEEAQRWVNLLGAGGYSTSLEVVEGSLPVRLRVGRFASLVDATHFLDHFKVHGTQGQILQMER